jgi:hypothetical protein
VIVIFAVDALMDMARTSVNLLGNCLASVVMARWEGDAALIDSPAEVGSRALRKGTRYRFNTDNLTITNGSHRQARLIRSFQCIIGGEWLGASESSDRAGSIGAFRRLSALQR